MDPIDLYSDRIIEIAANAPAPPRLANPHASARRVSRICGSVVEVDLRLGADGRVADYGHEVSACALGQTSAAIMARNVVGSTPAELLALRDRMATMLKADGPPPEGKWDELRYLEPVRDYPARHASTMLVFEAVAGALATIAESRIADSA